MRLHPCNSINCWNLYFVIFCILISYRVYQLRGGNAPWFICLFWRYINCLFVYLTSLRSSFLTSFLILSSLLIYFLSHLLPDLLHLLPDLWPGNGMGLFSCTSWLILVPEETRSVSRPEVTGGDQTCLFCVDFMLQYILVGMQVCFCCVWFSFF